MIEFFVHGVPVPQGSKRVIRGNVIEMGGARLRDWRQRCAQECQAAKNGGALLTGPVSVRATFFVARPKGHYRTGRNSALLRASAPIAPDTRPDADKLARALLDALTGIAFRDDGQVARLWVEKKWCDPISPGVEVSIWVID